MIIFSIVILIIVLLIFFRFNPRIDEISISNHRYFILWYDKDYKHLDRDYIILWET